MNTSYLFVGLGGAAGAIARVTLARALPSYVLGIPFKILCVNVLGCLLMGMLTEILAMYWNASMNMRHLLSQGFLGGFTTFSSFALEFGLQYEKGFHASAIIYAALSFILSIALFFGGIKLIRMFS
jgi:CrcB protein